MAKKPPAVDLASLPAWSAVVGRKATRVVVYEDMARNRMLTLRWRGGANWKRKTLGRFLERDRKGAIVAASDVWARLEATRKSVALGDGAETSSGAAPTAPFTIGETRGAITDPTTGKYPHDTPFRRELLRALDYAVVVWGPETAWADLTEAEWLALLRRKLAEMVRREQHGVRMAQLTVSRLSTAAKWLRRAKKIPADAGTPPENYTKEIRTYWRGIMKTTRDPKVHRPRHTLAELRAILAAAWDVDPRLGLLLAVGAEYRLGQVVRVKRSDLDLGARQLTVPGSGTKEGETILLTDGQMRDVSRALTGYLVDLELAYQTHGTDYPLFPAGQVAGRLAGHGHISAGTDTTTHLSRDWIGKNFKTAERKAQVAHVARRGAYGLRRVNVDAALGEGISPAGLQATGGWGSTKIPTEIYRDELNKAGREEAKRVRAKTRGEA